MDGENIVQKLNHYGRRLWQSCSLFWQWWSRQLLSLLPPHLSRRLLGQKQRLAIYPGQDGYRLALEPQGEQLTLTGAPAQADALDRLLKQADSTRLCLPAGELLFTRISLPAATAGNLANVLRFEMDRHTPFSADQVYFGFKTAPREKDNPQLQVSLLLAPKSQVDPMLAELEELGLAPATLHDADHPEAPAIPLPVTRSAAALKAGRMKNLNGALVLVMLFLLIAVPLYQRQNRIDSLDAQLNIPKQRAEQAAALKQQLEELQQSRQFLARERTSRPAVLPLLDELTRQLPDHTWLSRFELLDGAVQIRGESANASELIGLLEASPLFFDVRFSSPVTNNPATNKDRFMIDARFGEEASL
ncbi:general secretion pathway protein GspL [Zobellella denitrificans]|jgi:general secretion pathway protein L|uniref:type II secretion system protein GspL n=1 Tax=Zobellella denitrificans TaxID=347534 RepID=UPI000B8C6025|nr:type II secretion system protein GspL [Zobellella denitrificans]OXS15972.1 general secretion pathway protein GspL [Zobellella denitrificans]